MLADLIARSRVDARSQGLRQMIVVERYLCEREVAEIARQNVNDLLRYRVPGVLEAHNLRAVETSKSMIAWEADDHDDEAGQAGLFGFTAIKFVTDFDGEVVQITHPVFFKRGG